MERGPRKTRNTRKRSLPQRGARRQKRDLFCFARFALSCGQSIPLWVRPDRRRGGPSGLSGAGASFVVVSGAGAFGRCARETLAQEKIPLSSNIEAVRQFFVANPIQRCRNGEIVDQDAGVGFEARKVSLRSSKLGLRSSALSLAFTGMSLENARVGLAAGKSRR